MKLAVYTDVDLFDRLKPEWNTLLDRSASNIIFNTWEWQSTWWSCFQPGKLSVVTCRDDNDRLVGIAPWFVAEDETVRTMCTIGCIDVTDYLDVIIDEDCTGEVLNCLAIYLKEHRSEFDHLSFCNIPQDSPTLEYFPNLLNQQGFQTTVEQIEVSPSVKLPSEWADYVSSLGKKYRHELRRKMRRADGDVDWYIVDETHDLDAELEKFLTLMAASDAEKATFLEDENNVRFFKAIAKVLFERGWLQLTFLTTNNGEDTVASYFNLDYNEHILVYNSGLLRGDYDYLSGGIVLLGYNIRYAIENDYKVFDFLRGNETYKYHMGGQDVGVFLIKA